MRSIEAIEAEGRTINLRLEPDDVVLPCPFCGGNELELQNTHTAAYWIECQGCRAEVHGTSFGTDVRSDKLTMGHHRRAKRSAIAAWNRRTP